MTNYQHNLDQVIENIEKARLDVSGHHIVKIVAVSKYSDEEAIKGLLACGQRAFGENKVQDLLKKSADLEDLPIEWHFIGSLQKNKINHLIDANPFLMHSLDSLELAQALQSRLEVKNSTMDVLLQINAANEASKSGVSTDEALDIYAQVNENCPNINLQGVMTIGAHSQERTLIQKSFEDTYKIYEALPNKETLICSMGMSSDYELAIRCGSNMVRIGSALFK